MRLLGVMRLVWLLVSATALPACPALAQRSYGPGVTDTEIKIGQTMPYSGPLSGLGTHGRAMSAYFTKLNDEGGVNGRRIKLISLDRTKFCCCSVTSARPPTALSSGT
jgi:ABC-type branched-subunit amino acid transport system substrate-binding protein